MQGEAASIMQVARYLHPGRPTERPHPAIGDTLLPLVQTVGTDYVVAHPQGRQLAVQPENGWLGLITTVAALGLVMLRKAYGTHTAR